MKRPRIGDGSHSGTSLSKHCPSWEMMINRISMGRSGVKPMKTLGDVQDNRWAIERCSGTSNGLERAASAPAVISRSTCGVISWWRGRGGRGRAAGRLVLYTIYHKSLHGPSRSLVSIR